MTTAPIDIAIFVPGGILATDHVHRKTNDRTCSRCRKLVPDEEVPLMFWLNGDPRGYMLIYCGDCLDGEGRQDG